jgi:sarcosine oxidase
MNPKSDIAVIGAGCVGLATADALLERGESVAVYETGIPGQQQSGGEGRVFRHGHDDPRLIALAVESRERWRELESRFGEELVSPHGTVAVGESAFERLPKLEEAGAQARRIGADEVAERQPLLAPFDGEAVLDEAGGSIRTSAAIRLWSERVGDGLVQAEVIALRQDGDSVEIRLGGGDAFVHTRAVICAGRGTVALARGAGIEVPLNLSCHLRATFEVAGDPPERVSSFLDGDGRWGETGVYATAFPGNGQYSIGLAETMDVREDGSVIDPAQFAELDERVRAYVEKAMPGLRPEPVGQVHCWATDLPWNEDAIGVWEHEGILAIGGHNLWKMAPALGEALAEAATGGGVREELRPESRLGEG